MNAALFVPAALVRHYAHLCIKCLAPLLIRVGGAMKQSDPDPEAELGKSHNISAASLHPRLAAPRLARTARHWCWLGLKQQLRGHGRRTGGCRTIDNWSHIILCPADCLPFVVQFVSHTLSNEVKEVICSHKCILFNYEKVETNICFLDAWGAGEYFRYLNKTHMILYFASILILLLHLHMTNDQWWWWPGAWRGKCPRVWPLRSVRHAGLSLVHGPVTWPPAALWLVSWAPRVPVQTAASVESRKSSSGQNISPKMQEFNFLTLTNLRENGLKISSILS